MSNLRKTAELQRVLERLDKVRPSGDSYSAVCPAHPDRDPSMSVGLGADGQVMFNCHKGCTAEAITAALSLEMKDLFPPKKEQQERAKKTWVANYDYTDAEGNLIFQVTRWLENGDKTFTQRKPTRNGEWVYNTGGVDKPLYRLPEVIAAIRDKLPIYVVEGEKDVHTLEELGVTATTNSGGAQAWLPRHTAALKDADEVIVMADRDAVGMKRAQRIVNDLIDEGVNVRPVAPPEGHNDITDFIEKGGSLSGVVAVEFEEENMDPFAEVVTEFRGLVGKDWTMDRKLARARAILDKTQFDPTESGKLVRWDEFLNEPVEEYDWVIPGLLERQERVIVVAAEGVGKRLDLNTMIPTPTGWTTMGDIAVGHYLIDRFGNPCMVTYVSPTENNPDTYRVHFSDGNYLDADAEHQWYTETLNEREKRKLGSVRTTTEIRETLISGRKSKAKNHAIPVTAPLNLAANDLPIDPYTLGAWLGDGTTVDGSICSEDPEILENLAYSHRHRPSTKNMYGILGLKADLRANNLLGDKHIPGPYLRGSIHQRLALLQGLMDTDGTVGLNGACEFSVTNERLARGVHELILTMGIKSVFKTGVAKLNGRITGPRYRMHFKTSLPVFKLARKLKRLPEKLATPRSLYRYIVAIEKIDPAPMKCVAVNSPDHTYLAGDFIPTHNTMLARQVALMSSAGLQPFKGGKMPPMRTLFIDLENPERIIRRTSKKIMERVRWAGGQAKIEAHLLVKPDGVNILKPADRVFIERVVEQTQPDIIFLGPLYKAYIDPGGRTSEAVATEAAMFLDYIRSTYNCALWLEHHAPLGSSMSGRELRPFGSAVWSRWSEFGVSLSPSLTIPNHYDLKHYRGMRDVREWPEGLKRSENFPFEAIWG